MRKEMTIVKKKIPAMMLSPVFRRSLNAKPRSKLGLGPPTAPPKDPGWTPALAVNVKPSERANMF